MDSPPPLPKINRDTFKALNASPNFFHSGNHRTYEDFRLPPVSPVFMSPGRKESPAYSSTAMASFSPAHLDEYPPEMLPIRMEILRSKDETFSASFIAGAYRDNRLGVKELRLKRVERLRKQQAVIAQAQQGVVDVLAKMAAARDAKRRAKESAKMKKMLRCVAVIQRLMRALLARRATRRLVAERFLERKEKERITMAVRLQHWALKCLAYKFEMAQLEAADGEDSDSGDEKQEGEAGAAGGGKTEGGKRGGSTASSVNSAEGRGGTVEASTVDTRTSLHSIDSRNSLGSIGGVDGAEPTPAASALAAAIKAKALDGDGQEVGGAPVSSPPQSPGEGKESLARNPFQASHTVVINKYAEHLGHSEGASSGVAVSINARMEFKHRKANEEKLAKQRVEHLARLARPGPLAAELYLRSGVDVERVADAMLRVQMAARRFTAKRTAMKRRNALVLVGWFLGRFLKSAPLELQVVARLGQPFFGHYWLTPHLRLSSKQPCYPRRVRVWRQLKKDHQLQRRRQGWVHRSAPQPAAQLAKQEALAALNQAKQAEEEARVKAGALAAERALLARDKPRSPPRLKRGKSSKRQVTGAIKVLPTKSAGGGTASASTQQRGLGKNRPMALEVAPTLAEDSALQEILEAPAQPLPPRMRGGKPHAASSAWDPAISGKAMFAYIHSCHDKVAVGMGYHGRRRKFAIAIQCCMRGFLARKLRRAKEDERERERAKVSEHAAKALMARIPAEQPDHSAARQWLRDGNARGAHVGRLEASTLVISVGAVDLSRTSRGAFWLGLAEGGSSNAACDSLVSPGLRAHGGQVRRVAAGRAGGATGSSVRSMIGCGLGPYYSPYTT